MYLLFQIKRAICLLQCMHLSIKLEQQWYMNYQGIEKVRIFTYIG